jgi:hypothetical protein
MNHKTKGVLDFGFWIEGPPLHPFTPSPAAHTVVLATKV